MAYTRVAEFLEDWKSESGMTRAVMAALTDAALAQPAGGAEDRTLGRIAWHIVTTLPEMMERTGLHLSSVDGGAPVPARAADIAEAHSRAAAELAERLAAEWTDDTLSVTDNMYGETWPRGLTLQVLVRHEIHHRGQMTALMRLAGLRVPGTYGPAREDWAAMGMDPPAV